LDETDHAVKDLERLPAPPLEPPPEPPLEPRPPRPLPPLSSASSLLLPALLLPPAARTAARRSALAAAPWIVLVAHAAGAACFFRGELVRRAFFMGGPAAFGGDFALLLRVHGSEAAFAGVALLCLLPLSLSLVAMIIS
jgi:hypothetical protein